MACHRPGHMEGEAECPFAAHARPVNVSHAVDDGYAHTDSRKQASSWAAGSGSSGPGGLPARSAATSLQPRRARCSKRKDPPLSCSAHWVTIPAQKVLSEMCRTEARAAAKRRRTQQAREADALVLEQIHCLHRQATEAARPPALRCRANERAQRPGSVTYPSDWRCTES